jgi:hypothetical protein
LCTEKGVEPVARLDGGRALDPRVSRARGRCGSGRESFGRGVDPEVLPRLAPVLVRTRLASTRLTHSNRPAGVRLECADGPVVVVAPSPAPA